MEISRKMREIPVSLIRRGLYQPRKNFSEKELSELCASVKEVGILQPLTVRYSGDGFYELIAGERRLRAAKLLGLSRVPCVIAEADDCDAAVMALIENLQRKNLDYFEEAEGLSLLLRLLKITQEELSEKIGKSQSAVANKLRLLRIPPRLREKLRENKLSERHARALLSLKTEEEMEKTADIAIKNGFTVSKLEDYILHGPPKKKQTLRGFCADMRLYSNTIKQTVSLMKSSGISAKLDTEESDTEFVYKITVTK